MAGAWQSSRKEIATRRFVLMSASGGMLTCDELESSLCQEFMFIMSHCALQIAQGTRGISDPV